jgi:tetratricopeptide (TPR) repeat protein
LEEGKIMKKVVWLVWMLIIENSIAKDKFCLDMGDRYYLKSDSVSVKGIKLTVLTPKFQKDNELERKEGCINRLLIIKKNNTVIVNNKAILNNIDYQQDPFAVMKKEKDSISLEFEFGSINYANFTFNFTMINGSLQLNYKEYNFFNKNNMEVYLKGRDFMKDENISLETFNALEYIEIPVIPLTLETLEKEIKRKEHLDYYNIEYLESFLYVHSLSQKNLTAYNNIAYYFQKANANEESVYLLEKILEKFSKRTVAYYNLGDAYWALGQKKKAVKIYTTYIEQMCNGGKQKLIPIKVKDRISRK